MPTLYLLRHAKSSWDAPVESDHERPLNARGRDAAPRVGEWLRANWPLPALVLCSSATRTRETLALLGELGDPDVVVDDALYEAAASELLDRLTEIGEDIDPVLLVGHNPSVQRLATVLASSGERRDAVARKYPSGALAVLETPHPWRQLEPATCALLDFVVPRELA